MSELNWYYLNLWKRKDRRTSKKIFRGYREFLNNKRLVFTQKKFEDGGYDYYVQKLRYVKVK